MHPLFHDIIIKHSYASRVTNKKNSVKINQTQDSLLFLDDELTKPGLGNICLNALNAGSLENIFRNVKRCFQISHSGNFSKIFIFIFSSRKVFYCEGKLHLRSAV